MDDLDDLLHDLVAGVAPPVDPVHDIGRGRRRLRRRNALAGTTSAVALVAVASVGGLLFTGHTTDDPAQYADDPTQTVATQTQSASPTALPSGSPSTTARLRLPARPMARLESWRNTLAGYLDPKGEHLQKTVTGKQGGTDARGRPSILGTKLGWSGPGGTGMIQIEVYADPGKDWGNVGPYGDWSCGTAVASPPWTCTPVDPAGATRAVYATYPGGRAVAVQHPDGTVVVIDADQSFGNNGTTDADPLGIHKSRLLAAASDPAFTLARLARAN